jgi:hypothetical protein
MKQKTKPISRRPAEEILREAEEIQRLMQKGG